MIWNKLGIIFDPTSHSLNFECNNFAQSPQTIVFDNFVRVYFSTRVRDSLGLYLSIIKYVDFDRTFSKIIGHSNKEVLSLGKPGTFDEHGIFPFNPLKLSDRIIAYTCGWSRRISVSVETSTGLVVSIDNGNTFARMGDGPILTATRYEPMLVGDSFVTKENDLFHMLYIFGKCWFKSESKSEPERIYKIAYANSNDGVNWQKQEGIQIIADVLGEYECQALPSVLKIGSTFHMYFCYRYATDFRTNPSRGYRLGYAYSKDLRNWVRDDANKGIDLSKDGWDSKMMCYPHIFRVNDEVYLLYNGDNFGQYGFGLARLIKE